ncbi:MAG: ABC transporter ATP-binding protein [Candidatus Bathyarchaeota archaeon]|nr:ABC transporter ATP-binding protein [Candidatus Bathyarchaeota archaeon]
MQALGEFNNLEKSFSSGTKALSGLSFKIYKGTNGLIGPNGAGKTTTIKLSLGLIKADAGAAEMFGFDCWKQSLQIRRKTGILYEKVAFYEHLSGIEHLKLMAKLKGLSDPLSESKRVLKLVELDTEAQNRRIGGYSAGMRQRIGLAHALLGNPELIILDEPTSNLDPIGRAKVIEIINSLKKEGFSFLISSHILHELEKVCDKFVLINKGRTIKNGTLNQLLDKTSTQAFTIKVQPLKQVAELLKKEECIKDTTIIDNQIIVIANDSEKFKKILPRVVSKVDGSLEEVKPAGRDLESIFKVAVEEAEQ